MKPITYLLALLLLLFSGQAVMAQANGKNKEKTEYEKEKNKDKKEKKKAKKAKKAKKENADKDKGKAEPTDAQLPGQDGHKKDKQTGPRKLNGVPPGHFPPAGQCRVWYPNRPPGHQLPPVDCRSLVGVKLEPGAFILHGDKAYDAEYDWRAEEKRNPGSVAREIFDILFPPSR